MQARTERSRRRRQAWAVLVAGLAIFAIATQPVVGILGGALAVGAGLELLRGRP